MQVLITTTLEPDHLDCLVGSFPEVVFHFLPGLANSPPDGVRPEVLLCGHVTEDLLKGLPDLKWVQVRSAGVDHLPLQTFAERGILLTNGSGIHGIAVAETVMAMMLAFATGLPQLIRGQDRREWVRPTVAPGRFELENQTLLIIGLGDLGATLARKARGIGMRVIGCDRERVAGVLGLSRFVPVQELDKAIPEADHVALCLPLTPETRGIFHSGRIRAMKPTAYLYNVGRGALIDQNALVEALRDGAIAGAGLDVTHPEPLPPDHALWGMPNVLLTQHIGGASPFNSRRIADLFSENLHRYKNGYPLLNLVDLSRGY